VLELSGGTGQWSLITVRVALEDLVEQALDTLINHKGTVVKMLVQPYVPVSGRQEDDGGRAVSRGRCNTCWLGG
jgi:hypothetical protein